MSSRNFINIDGAKLEITNPEKILWAEHGISKAEYISIITALAPFLIPYTNGRILTTIRFPDGASSKSFYQKSCPAYAPEWVNTITSDGKKHILLNNLPTLIWLANLAALEFHVEFNQINTRDCPDSIVFDLDPGEGQGFEAVRDAAGKIYEILKSLDIKSFAKTSGATGLQIYIPVGCRYSYEKARSINSFFGKYFSQKYPQMFTIERSRKGRGNKLYFDYLQMWSNKTIIAPYSPRATQEATVSTPFDWAELNQIKPEDFTIRNILNRVLEKGDLFKPTLAMEQNLDFISKKLTPKSYAI